MTGESTGGRHWLGLALVMPKDDNFGAPRNGLRIHCELAGPSLWPSWFDRLQLSLKWC